MTETSLEILVGTGNAGKAAEICFALRDLGIDFRTLAQVPDVLFVNESGLTYEENAILKATSYSRQFSMWTIADDSGLEVEALGGAPGVLSARYAGAGKSDADRIDYLLGQIANAPDTTHAARFVCSMVLADSRSRILHVARGICEGTITDRPSGDNGFGYDPIFIPAGFDATFGELPAEVKNAISHRGAALKSMRVFMEQFLSSNLTDGVSNS